MDETTVVIDGKSYQLIKTGRAQAEQVILVTKWISRHGIPALKELQKTGGLENTTNSIEFVGVLIEALSADALLDLFTVIIGCSAEVAETHFDAAVLIDGLVTVYDKQPVIRRLIERFFSTPASEAESQEK